MNRSIGVLAVVALFLGACSQNASTLGSGNAGGMRPTEICNDLNMSGGMEALACLTVTPTSNNRVARVTMREIWDPTVFQWVNNEDAGIRVLAATEQAVENAIMACGGGDPTSLDFDCVRFDVIVTAVGLVPETFVDSRPLGGGYQVTDYTLWMVELDVDSSGNPVPAGQGVIVSVGFADWTR